MLVKAFLKGAACSCLSNNDLVVLRCQTYACEATHAKQGNEVCRRNHSRQGAGRHCQQNLVDCTACSGTLQSSSKEQ
eukprot:2242141-Pleurochrysis_carterae.AAC.3